jgi:hypothetical protein
MKGNIRNLIVTTFFIVAAGGLAGCATANKSIESGNDLAAAATGNPVVFGKFRLIRNGNEARLGSDMLSTTATLTLRKAGSAEEFVGAVGANGEFAWALEPGFYRVARIGFDNRGDRVEPITNFTFRVSGDHEAVYIGTVTLEATFDSGYYGLNGVVDGYAVSNDCATDCAPRLERLGLAADDLATAVMYQPSPVASTN